MPIFFRLGRSLNCKLSPTGSASTISTFHTWTNKLGRLSSGLMKPKPRSSRQVLTLPVRIERTERDDLVAVHVSFQDWLGRLGANQRQHS
jgi:hypothetical protein